MAVARFESTFFMPTFAKIAVSPAKIAESKAKINQDIKISIALGSIIEDIDDDKQESSDC